VIQPGIRIRHVEGQPGTVGAFALHRDGRVVLVAAEHTITNHWRARLGDPLILESIDSGVEGEVSIRIPETSEDFPAVLKQPAEPFEEMNVVKFGWATGRTEGKILATHVPVNVAYQDRKKRRLDNLIMAEIKADHGDSGSLLLSADTHRPLGVLEAKHEVYPDICYFVKAGTIARKLRLLGFYCPMEIPQNSPEDFETVIKSLIPDGYFEQTGHCISKDWRRVARTIGMGFPDYEEIKPYDVQEYEAERSMSPGDDARYVGRLVLNRDNKVVGLIFAGSDVVSVSMHLSKIEAALDLRLIGVFGW